MIIVLVFYFAAELHPSRRRQTPSSSRRPASQRPVSVVFWTWPTSEPTSEPTSMPTTFQPLMFLFMRLSTHTGQGNGKYCSPKIYFNHRCFSGPYLNKGRIAELPQFIGPGNCVLVLKEVSWGGGRKGRRAGESVCSLSP